MLESIEGLVRLPETLALLAFVVVVVAIILIVRRERLKRLVAASDDLEFIVLLNDQNIFCDSDEEFSDLLERESSEPPAAVETER